MVLPVQLTFVALESNLDAEINQLRLCDNIPIAHFLLLIPRELIRTMLDVISTGDAVMVNIAEQGIFEVTVETHRALDCAIGRVDDGLPWINGLCCRCRRRRRCSARLIGFGETRQT